MKEMTDSEELLIAKDLGACLTKATREYVNENLEDKYYLTDIVSMTLKLHMSMLAANLCMIYQIYDPDERDEKFEPLKNQVMSELERMLNLVTQTMGKIDND